jgi:L-2,4-diaminobutyrate decarboxylase
MVSPMFESEFLAPSNQAPYREAIAQAVETLLASLPDRPYSGKSAAELSEMIGRDMLPSSPSPLAEVLKRAIPQIAHSQAVYHPHTIAHLHAPPLIASLAGELITAALNQSQDSFDLGPMATVLELAMCEWLCKEVGLPAGADAIFTSGGTQSNFMGLLLARDACAERQWNWSVQKSGLPPEANRMRFLCSEMAHFTVEKSASQLGLGSDAVIKIRTDDDFRLDLGELTGRLQQMNREGLVPAAVVATAGTTDFGSIDPLRETAQLARQFGAWFHVDAAYGSALLLSNQHRDLLDGIDLADSITVDFHKKFWQPISCGAFLLRDSKQFKHLRLHADYLNPESHEELGIPNLVGKSLATSRRFDALKLWMSFQAMGRTKFGQMVDRTLELAAYAARRIGSNPALELLHEPALACVVFRYIPAHARADADALNAELRQRLFERGVAIIGHTRVHGRQCLKFTCMNPAISEGDLDALLDEIVKQGRDLEDRAA